MRRCSLPRRPGRSRHRDRRARRVEGRRRWGRPAGHQDLGVDRRSALDRTLVDGKGRTQLGAQKLMRGRMSQDLASGRRAPGRV